MSNNKERSTTKIPPYLIDPDKPAVRSNINIEYINYKKMNKRKRRMRAFRERVLVGTLVLVCAFGGMTGAKALKHRLEAPPYITVPEGYMLVPTEEIVQYGDTIYSIAGEYYDENLYSGVYNNIHDYVKAILKQNSLRENTYIHPGDYISLMAITSLENEYLTEINLLREQINNIQEENLWVQHRLVHGDSYSSLASKASGNARELYEIMEQIRDKNKDQTLITGDLIWIMNPELGELKSQLRETQDQFRESLKNKENKKSVK